MKSASTMIEITPPIGMAICGNIRKDNISRGVHDPLVCNAILCEHEETTVLFLVMDWAGIEVKDAKAIRERMADELNIPSENVIVSATHTHSGPYTIEMMDDAKESDKVRDYILDSTGKIAQAVAQLPDAMEQVSLWSAQTHVEGLSFCRRLRMADGKVVMNWNEVDPTDVVCATGKPDKQMSVVGFKRADGTWQTIMVNFALHPAICVGRDWLWSADWVHYLRESLRNTYAEKPIVHFINGAQGDVNHLNFEKFCLDAFPEAERYGYALAKHVVSAIDGSCKAEDKLKVAGGAVALYKRTIPREWTKWAKAKWAHCKGEIPELLHGIPSEFYAKEIIAMESQQGDKYIFPMAAVKLGDMAFVSLPGEIFSSVALDIKRNSPHEKTAVMGLTLGSSGYIPDEKAFLEGGYETRIGAGSQFETDSCERIKSVAGNLLELL
ncbi:MAG: hypothetical protein HN948_03340 [Clostridia bacterium]|jgi:neutral ceramidase|nr:hypothetical protein [Clostridia bacterium]MBT7122026.1 hypothetical protein [Clostridia bacterium]